jgi:excisionase family DNA binding protein
VFSSVAQCGDKRNFKLQVLSYDEAAKRVNLVRRSLERRIAIGEGPAIIHLGKRRRGILESDLEAWLTARRHAPPGETKSTPADEDGAA